MTATTSRNGIFGMGALRKGTLGKGWLPDMDLNHDKQIQSLLCYRYTIGQCAAHGTLGHSAVQSSRHLSDLAF
jgi:hypothetical protein